MDTRLLNNMIHNVIEEISKYSGLKVEAATSGNYHSAIRIAYANPQILTIILGLIFALIVLIICIIYRYRLSMAKVQAEKEKAEAENKAKSDFLSRMSHEIRTPMNAIIGLTDITVRKENLPDEIRENMQKLQSASYYLLSLLNDILDVSRINSGRVVLNITAFSLKNVVDDICLMMDEEARRKNIIFEKKITIDDYWVSGDEIRLKQIIMNLLSNAIKYTEPGGKVVLSVIQTAKIDGRGGYRISVKDTGIGIAENEQKKVFEAFEQSSGNINSSLKGTGLGLAISKNFVELMGGTLSLNSKLGEGSDFYFSISLKLSDMNNDESKVFNEKNLNKLKVLLAEDNDLNAEITTELLEYKGVSVERACNGREAVDLFIESNLYYYDVILMDIQMPELNGFEASKIIRQSNREDAKAVKIVALTANNFTEDIEEAKKSGMDDFIAKPINVDNLYRKLIR